MLENNRGHFVEDAVDKSDSDRDYKASHTDEVS